MKQQKKVYVVKDDIGDSDCPKYVYDVIKAETRYIINSFNTFEEAVKWVEAKDYYLLT